MLTHTFGEPLLTIDNVSVSYDGVPVLKNITAEIKDVNRPGVTQGQVVGMLALSGTGKTTLARVIAGLLPPTEGRVLLEKVPIQGNGDVGLVAQNYPLLLHRTVLGNLMRAGLQSGMTKKIATETAKEYLALFELSEHVDKYPGQLSGGQRQRIAIAQQLMCQQRVIIFDEPFSGLDIVSIAKTRGLLLKVANMDERNTLIIVTHSISDAVSICDTLWLLGRDRGPNNRFIPGARLMKIVDLMELDICWYDDPLAQPNARPTIDSIKQHFLSL